MHITLTSIPPRFDGLYAIVANMLLQNSHVSSVNVYLPKSYKRFGRLGLLPRLPDDNRVRVRVVDHDYGPLTKVVYAFDDYPNEDILVCDDDMFYPPDWVENFVRWRQKYPEAVLCMAGAQLDYDGKVHRGVTAVKKGLKYRLKRLVSFGLLKPERVWTRSGLVDIVQGWAGVCLRSEWLPADIRSIPEALFLVDDIWISGSLERMGVQRVLIAPGLPVTHEAPGASVSALKSVVEDGCLDRDRLDRRAIQFMREEYGIWV